MGKGNINIFGVKFAYPKGLRKSPGTNWLASCVRNQLSGKKPGNRGEVIKAFTRAAAYCSQQGSNWASK